MYWSHLVYTTYYKVDTPVIPFTDEETEAWGGVVSTVYHLQLVSGRIRTLNNNLVGQYLINKNQYVKMSWTWATY